MLCASCGSPQPDEARRCALCHGPILLDGRYALLSRLDVEGQGDTYEALRLHDGQRVAIKELSFKRMRSLKSQELFEREARVLAQLHHPGIPAHLDDFAWGVGKHQAHYLVQTLIEGHTLTQEARAHRYDEGEVLALIESLCEIVAYLHERSPPVIHRDIKPDNVMRRAADGRLMLIDFGAVHDQLASTLREQTLVGTLGYMAPEQLAGQAERATDVYGLGVLAIVLLTQRQPVTMLDPSGALRWQPHARLSPAAEALLCEMTRPEPQQRPSDARAIGARARAIRLGKPHAQGAMSLATTQAIAPAPPGREESLFGLVSVLLFAPLLGLPCLIASLGFGTSISVLCVALLSMVLVIPFLPRGDDLRL